MSITSGFFNSANNDRVYSATEMSRLFNGLILDGVYLSSKDGDTLNQQFKTVALDIPAMKIKVSPGRAWFKGHYIVSDSDTIIDISASTSLGRIDVLVIELDTVNRVSDLKIIQGTPAQHPERPEIDPEEGVYQYPIAYITVRANAAVIEKHDVNYVVGIDTPYFAWLGETLDISENYSKWETELGRITGPFDPWLDSMKRMLGHNNQDYSLIKQEVENIQANPIAIGLYPKVNEMIEEETGDGTTTVYDLSSLNINVLADILIDNKIVYDYTYENNVVTFKEAPADGSVIKFCYVPNNDLNKYTLYFEEV